MRTAFAVRSSPSACARMRQATSVRSRASVDSDMECPGGCDDAAPCRERGQRTGRRKCERGGAERCGSGVVVHDVASDRSRGRRSHAPEHREIEQEEGRERHPRQRGIDDELAVIDSAAIVPPSSCCTAITPPVLSLMQLRSWRCSSPPPFGHRREWVHRAEAARPVLGGFRRKPMPLGTVRAALASGDAGICDH